MGFESLFGTEFKNIFKDAISGLLHQNALSVACKLDYDTTDDVYCNNCIYDPILGRSFNKYNQTGPVSFVDGSICPVCAGFGKILCDTSEIVYLGIIFDSKYWLNWGPQFVEIPNLAAQTLCPITLMPKILNCNRMKVVNNELYDNGTYSKAGQPTPMGLGDSSFILTNWTRP